MKAGALYILCTVVVLFTSGCRGLKHATPERPLFAGYEVVFSEDPEHARAIRTELTDVVEPQPNTSLFGIRPAPALYNSVKEPKREGKGLRHLLKYKIASPPVYLEDVPLKDVDAALVNRMNNRGHFSATAQHETFISGRTARVRFTVVPGPGHHLRNIVYGDTAAAPGDSLIARLRAAQRRSPLKPGGPYYLAALVEERARVVTSLRNTGYYRLTEDDLEFAADTSVGDHLVDLRLRVKALTSSRKRARYTIGEVRVHGDCDEQLPPTDTVLVDSLLYVDYLGMYRPSTIVRGVLIRPGQLYAQRRVDQTRQHLASFGVFQGVTVEFTDDSLRQNVLDADVLLTPQKRFSLYSELNAVSKSNNFTGPGVKVGFKDRDLFRGAELLTLDLGGRIESQLTGTNQGTYAYEITTRASLSVPRLLLFNRWRTARAHAPATRFQASYGLFRRIGLYGLEAMGLGYGYVWRRNERIWHDVHLPEVSYNKLYYTSAEFDAFLSANPVVRRSFEQQFIVGVGYTYTWNSRRSKRNAWLFSIGGDEGGNILSALWGIDGPRPAEGYTLFNEPFAQFARAQTEVRFSRRLDTRGTLLAVRMLAGAAFAYGNSTQVPYVKQFFSGGTNSVRAFPARGIGPGTYRPPEGSSAVLVDQVGDIKFEMNVEYRFTISGIVKGALFADAGNVWLNSEDPQRPGGKFQFDQALAELAVGAGAGIRIDPEVIVIRLDLATPLRRPDLGDNDRWTFDDQQPQLFDNVILNIAVGYPF